MTIGQERVVPEPLTDERIKGLLDQAQRFERAFKPEAVDKLIDAEKTSLAAEVQRYRFMVHRLEGLVSRLTGSPLAAELRSAMSGTAYLYCCPVHGKRPTLSQKHENGVLCKSVDVVRGTFCSETAQLIGTVTITD